MMTRSIAVFEVCAEVHLLNDKESNEIIKSRQSFTADLDAIETLVKAHRVKVEEIERVLDGRGFASLALILSLPFVQPIPLPGLSMVFGVAFMALGLRLVLGRAGGLPQWVRRREIDGVTLQKMIHGARKIFAYVERFFKPRLALALRPPLESLVGLGIMLSGFAMTLPLPPVVLFSNSLPAWAIICLCLGYLERDGLVVVIGHVVALATWVYYAFWWEAVKLAWSSVGPYLPPFMK
ncbi:MAG: exopolysaccharide biosynthesis protein [Proteobacteria bacterium]|nr:exopolysaccharide biosynthesis protein [Pseudomonadota bacterium]